MVFGPNKFPAFTEETRAALIAGFRQGLHEDTAAARARVDHRSVYRWRMIGQDALRRMAEGEEVSDIEKQMADFYLDIMEAQGNVEAKHIQEIRDAANEGNWVASMTFLERRFPQRWRKSEVQEHVGPGGGPIQHLQLDNSASQLAELVDVLKLAGVVVQLPGAATPLLPITDGEVEDAGV